MISMALLSLVMIIMNGLVCYGDICTEVALFLGMSDLRSFMLTCKVFSASLDNNFWKRKVCRDLGVMYDGVCDWKRKYLCFTRSCDCCIARVEFEIYAPTME